MRTTIAALGVALLTLTLPAPVVSAAPTEVSVRIEGRGETLFEGPILTDGHNIRAASDSKSPQAGRRCNGLNNGASPTPGPTPTAASVDAMSILGEDFDGLWYAEPFEDYFIKRWGPDGQDEGEGEYWGVAVNNVFTSVGGCQYQLDGGDEVVWVYDAFSGRPRLGLYPADYSGGAKALTVTAELNVPLELDVVAWDGFNEGSPPASPQRTESDPFEGAEVAPVSTNAKGFELIETESADTVLTDENGEASVSFDEPGWHRIKATSIDSSGEETVIRSNRLDVCVPEPPASDCGALPAEDQVRIPPPVETEEPEPETEEPANGPEQPGSSADPVSPTANAAQVRLRLRRLDRSRVAQGLVKASWRVLDGGVGIEGWTIASQALGHKGARYVNRARGTSATSALLRLPRGATYRLRMTVVDALGRSSSAAIGRVRVPA